MRVFVARHFEIDFLQMSASKKGNEVNEGSSLESITKQLAEMKKKIQLLGEYAQSFIFNERANKLSSDLILDLFSCRGTEKSVLRYVGQ